jgi:medium-chain acyl-[acyl-carrier-protein] hydrolase
MQCRWLLNLKRTPNARRCLVIAPHAGGNAQVFRYWAEFIPADTDLFAIQYPGRGERMDETPYTDVRTIAAEVTPVLMQQLRAKIVFLYGHSMGAFVVYEIAKCWERERGHGIAKLIVSGCRAPHYPRSQPPLYHLPRTEFVEELRSFGGTPDDVLDDSDLMDLLMPIMRADFLAAQTYSETQPTTLLAPIVACAGDRDPRVRQDEVQGWRQCTMANFSAHVLPGDHFFPFASPQEFLSLVFARP